MYTVYIMAYSVYRAWRSVMWSKVKINKKKCFAVFVETIILIKGFHRNLYEMEKTGKNMLILKWLYQK